MKNTIFTLLIVLFFITNSNAQYLYISGGISKSSFKNNIKIPILNENINTNSFLIGFDFSKMKYHQNIHISSEIGYLEIGGKNTIEIYNDNDYIAFQKANFLHTNTIIKYVFLKNNNINMFIGIGPYVNLLLNNNGFTEPIYSGLYKYNKIHIGGKSELGVSVDYKKSRMGLSGFYMPNITPVAKSSALNLNSQLYGITIKLGHKI